MRDIAAGIAAWRERGIRFAIATVVQTWKSAPRQPGAAMAVSENGEVLGSISGGCVEGAVYELATESIRSGHCVFQAYGISDDDALGAGLTCGGIIEVFIQPADSDHFPELDFVLEALQREEPIALATIVSANTATISPNTATPDLGLNDAGQVPAGVGRRLVITPSKQHDKPAIHGSLGNVHLEAGVLAHSSGMLVQGINAVVHLGFDGEQRKDDLSIFVQTFTPPPRMLVFGAIDFASAVARIGKFLGYHVTVCDARSVFATRKRFPEVDELVVKWPHRFLDEISVDDRTVICVLTHDPKFDVPVLQRALQTSARYIGVMGSRRTHDDRLRRLKEAGVTAEAIARLSSPIGLDLGARTPEETAVAIAAEIIALNWGGTGQRLSAIDSPIHS